MFGPQFWSQFFPNLFATFSGIALALLLNRFLENRAKKSEERILLSTMRDNIDLAVDFCKLLKVPLQDTKSVDAPNARIDVAYLEAATARLAHLSSDGELAGGLMGFRFLAEGVNRTLERMTDLLIYPIDEHDTKTKDMRIGRLLLMADVMVKNLDRIIHFANTQVLPRIDARLKGEPPPQIPPPQE